MKPGLFSFIVLLFTTLQTTHSTINGKETVNFLKVKNATQQSSDLKIELNEETKSNLLNLDQKNSNDVVRKLPTSIEVRADSILYSDAGQQIVINFEITNNEYKYKLYIYEGIIEDSSSSVRITPTRSQVSPYSKTLVRVEISPKFVSKGTSRGLFTFKTIYAYQYEEVTTQEVYYYTGTEKSDTSNPSISFTFNGDCSGFLHPQNCHERLWKTDISIEDTDSGLLAVKSDPVGLILNKKFIVGTKEELYGYYRATCCQSKVDVSATDVSGNEKIVFIDIEKKWLSTGEIISIVLGAILIVVLIIFIILCIIWMCRRKRRSLSIYPDSFRS